MEPIYQKSLDKNFVRCFLYTSQCKMVLILTDIFFFLCRTNCCIGQHNHRSFLAAIIMFIVTGLWGIYLSFLTVCTSRDSSILHLDCSNVYSDPRQVHFTSCYVTVTMTCYHLCNLSIIKLVKLDLYLVNSKVHKLQTVKCKLG